MKAHDHVNGAAMAAMLSGAIGAFAMGAFVLLHEAAVYSAPAFYGPAGGLSDGRANFWILNAMSMPVGSTIAKQGAFATAVGTFAFRDETKIDAQQPYGCSQLMVVTRLSQTHWRVTTDVDPDAVYFNTVGLVVTPGSIAQLDASDGSLRGNYTMSFGADIICPTCK